MGPIETGVLADLADITGPGTEGMKATAVRLARTLDGDAGLATAAVARELRACLSSLMREGTDEHSDALAALITRMSAPVQHAPN